MGFQLRGFRSLWGSPSAAQLGVRGTGDARKDAAQYGAQLLARVAAQGFDGIEASLGDVELIGGADAVREQLQAHNLQLILGVYSGWTDYEDGNVHEQFDGVARHLERYRAQLERACAAFPDNTRPLWINAHSGSDHWSKLDRLEFVAHALEIESELGVHNLSHETHRGRMFYSPWPTLELLEAFPGLKLTLDLSHWCVVTERLLDTPFDERWLQRVLPHVYHVHGRVGTAQSSQIAQLPGDDAVQTEIERFEKLWTSVWAQQHARFVHADLVRDIDPVAARAFSTFTPEYGPVPYAPRDPKRGDRDAYDVDALCEAQMDRQRDRFGEFIAERAAERAAKDYA